MSNYSDWRSDLREVMDDEVDDKQVKEKKVNNAKLIKINPKLGEAVEELGGHIVEVSELEDKQSDKEFEDDADVKKAEQNKKKEDQLKKRIIRMKLRGLNQGSGDTLVAHNEPEGELIEGKKKGLDGKACWDGYKLAGTKKKGGKTVDNCVKEASAVLDANTKIKNKEDRKKKEKEYARLMSILAHQKDLKKRGLGEEHVDESKGHKGDDSFIEGETGSKTSRRNLTRAMSSTRIGLGKGEKGKAEDSAKRRERHQADRGVKTRGTKAGHSGSAYPTKEKTLDDTYPHKKEARLKAKLAARKSGEKYVDHTHHSLKKKTVGEKLPKVNEGVMKFIKDRVGGKKKPEKKASMDPTTDKLHNLRKDKFKTDRQKEHEKFVNFLDVDEEVVTELNRYGKETGKATGSLNKRPGSPVATSNQPNSPVNTVRRMIRKDTGKPEGQQKKIKGSPRGQQPGDRKLTPAQTISRMRAQVAAADAAMRDTRGT